MSFEPKEDQSIRLLIIISACAICTFAHAGAYGIRACALYTNWHKKTPRVPHFSAFHYAITNILPVAICCCLDTCNVYVVVLTFCLILNLLPEAICYCLQTC